MKHTRLSLITFCVFGLITVASCTRQDYNATPPTSLNMLFSDIRSTPQNLSVQAGRDTIVFAANGTMLHFYINSFKDATGNVITNSIINLSLVEMYKPADMIANRTTTVTTNGSMLKSGGEVNITAYKDNQLVYANKYGIGFGQDSYSNQPMELYYGNTTNKDSVSKWTISDTTQAGTTSHGTMSDSSGYFHSTVNNYIPPKPWYYVFDSCTTFTTTNCDHYEFYTGPVTNITLVIPDTKFNNTNTEFYLILPAEKIIVGMGNPSGTNSYTLNLTFNSGVPVGLNYVLVALANLNGTYYYFENSGVTTSGLSVNGVLSQDTRLDILDRMAKF